MKKYRTLTRTTGPTDEPVSLEFLKRHARIETVDEDVDINAKLRAAVRFIERQHDIAIIDQTWTMTLDRFPSTDRLYVPIRPVDSIASITYTDADGATQTWSGADYRLIDSDGLRPFITYVYGGGWPAGVRFDLASVAVVFVAGYGVRADVPADLQQAIALLVATHYSDREIGIDVPTGADHQYRDLMRGLGIVPDVVGMEVAG